MAFVFEVNDGLIIFDYENDQIIFDLEKACHMTIFCITVSSIL